MNPRAFPVPPSVAATVAASPYQPLVVDGAVDLTDFAEVCRRRRLVMVGAAARTRLAAAERRMRRCIDEARIVYGITTGFGPLADRLVSPHHVPELQRNLIYHLASGV